MGVIHHSVDLEWLEMARVDYRQAAGFDYGRMEREDGILMVVVETHCRFAHPTRLPPKVLAPLRNPGSTLGREQDSGGPLIWTGNQSRNLLTPETVA